MPNKLWQTSAQIIKGKGGEDAYKIILQKKKTQELKPESRVPDTQGKVECDLRHPKNNHIHN